MFGQASNRWLSPTTSLLLAVAFFTVHITSSLSLSSNVDNMPVGSENFARMRLSLTESPAGEQENWESCAKKHEINQNMSDYDCSVKGTDEKYQEMGISHCKGTFVSIECQLEYFCQVCKQFSLEKFSEERKTYYKSMLDLCTQWDSVSPKLPISDCPERPAGHTGADDSDHSPKSSSFFSSTTGIIVVSVVVIVVIAIGGLISWCMCYSSDGGDRAAGKSKGNKSTKSKGGKSAKSQKAKSTKSKGGKSAKSLKAKSKGGKSIKAKSAKSKGGKSMKAKSAKG